MLKGVYTPVAGRGGLYSITRQRWRQRLVGISDGHGHCSVRICDRNPREKPTFLVELPDGMVTSMVWPSGSMVS